MTARVPMKIRKKKERSQNAAEAYFKALGYKTTVAKKKSTRVVPPLVAFVIDEICTCIVCRAHRRTIGTNN